jgi:hypothetical protein
MAWAKVKLTYMRFRGQADYWLQEVKQNSYFKRLTLDSLQIFFDLSLSFIVQRVAIHLADMELLHVHSSPIECNNRPRLGTSIIYMFKGSKRPHIVFLSQASQQLQTRQAKVPVQKRVKVSKVPEQHMAQRNRWWHGRPHTSSLSKCTRYQSEKSFGLS